MQIRCNDKQLLHPSVRVMAFDLADRFASETGKSIHTFETWRSYSRQDLLLAQGKTKAKSGFSFHNYGLAIDLVPGGPGAWAWDDDAIDWSLLGEIGKSVGFSWGGDWAFKDMAHFQLDILSIQECQKISFKHGELAVWAELASLL